MTKSYEFTGRTTEEAISAGLKELNLVISDVNVEVLVEGSKGLFGLFGSRPAKVRMTVKEDEEEKQDSLFAHMLDEPNEEPAEKKQKKTSQKKADAPVSKEVKNEEKSADTAKQETAKKPVKAETEKKETVKKESEKKETATKDPEKKDTDKKEQKRPARKPKTEKVQEEAIAEQAEEKAEEKPLEPAEIRDPATNEGKAQQFLMNVTRQMGVDVQVYANLDEEGNVRVNMMGDSKGILIGRRGETLDALQYLTSLTVNKGQNDYVRVTLDTENYRAKREEALTRLANRMANRCQKTGKRVSLEPMNPYERRIMHAALQNHSAVTTHSEGEEPNRHVVITLK